MSCLGGDGVAVAHSLSDIFRLQGRQCAAQASCAGSLQCVFTSFWTSSVLRSLQTALGWSVISTETVHPSLSSPPWFVPWHSALPMKLGCLFNETNYKCNYPGFICQRNRYKIWKKKDYKWSKSQLNNGIHPLLHYWPGMQTASSFPSFLAEDHYVSGLAASLRRRVIPIFKCLTFTALHAWCIVKLFVVHMFGCVSALQHILRFLLLKRYRRNRYSLLTCLWRQAVPSPTRVWGHGGNFNTSIII